MFCFFVIFLLIVSSVSVTYEFKHNNKGGYYNNWESLPEKSDLMTYLESLRKVIDFSSKNKQEIDVNYELGLFFTNVHLKSVLWKKQNKLPNSLLNDIISMLNENDNLLNFFSNMVRVNTNLRDQGNKLIALLFSNETQWIRKLPNFNFALMEESIEKYFQEPPSWDIYNEYVFTAFCDGYSTDCALNPRLYDKCMVSLARNEVTNTLDTQCEIFEGCSKLFNGTEFGYAYTHRLLFLLLARYARGCSIFSYEDDREFVKMICAMVYDEADYIATNYYGIIDLFLEQIALCALDGHAKFLQRDWLSDILRFQTPYGCFNVSPVKTRLSPDIESPPQAARMWTMSKTWNHTIMNGMCNGHVTSVAAATLSAAARFILEFFY